MNRRIATLVAITLTIVMLTGLVACKSTPVAGNETTADTTVETVVETNADTEVTTEATTEDVENEAITQPEDVTTLDTIAAETATEEIAETETTVD